MEDLIVLLAFLVQTLLLKNNKLITLRFFDHNFRTTKARSPTEPSKGADFSLDWKKKQNIASYVWGPGPDDVFKKTQPTPFMTSPQEKLKSKTFQFFSRKYKTLQKLGWPPLVGLDPRARWPRPKYKIDQKVGSLGCPKGPSDLCQNFENLSQSWRHRQKTHNLKASIIFNPIETNVPKMEACLSS